MDCPLSLSHDVKENLRLKNLEIGNARNALLELSRLIQY
jgi:hypothetical protein